MKTTYTDPYGARLTVTQAKNNHAHLSMTDGGKKAHILLTPGVTMATTVKIRQTSDLSISEVTQARKIRVNNQTRKTEPGAPTGDYSDSQGNTILVSPERGHAVTLEIIPPEDDKPSAQFEIRPKHLKTIINALRAGTGLSGADMVIRAIEEGYFAPFIPTDERGKAEHEKFMQENESYAKVVAYAEARKQPGSSFFKEQAA